MPALPPLIRGVEYDAEKKVLTMQFQVGSYEYAGVPEGKGKGMLSAFRERGDSPDTDLFFFNRVIEGKYKSARVES